MKLIVITPSKNKERELETVVQLFEHGLSILHVRKPKMSTKEMRQYIETIPKHFHNRIVVHSHHKLATQFGLRGIHVTRYHQRKKFRLWLRLRWMRLQKNDLTLSTSYRKLADLYNDKGEYAYVFLSPIFDPLTNRFQSGYNEHSIRAALEKNKVCVIARGGVNAERLEEVQTLGFGGGALYSSIWKSTDPVAEFVRVLDEGKRLGIRWE